jgi:hypothetical protein
MKVGDLIRNISHPQAGIGIIVELGEPRFEPDCVIAVFPEHGSQIVYADEIETVSELSDDQLENIRGGMSSKTFDILRAEKINEGG